MPDELTTIYVACASNDEAMRIAGALLHEHLAACGNILPGITSIFRWQGRVEKETEVALLLKTRRELIERVTARIRDLHSYDTPCVVAWPIIGGDAEYAAWVRAETSALVELG